jgi:uroporphyrinogen-III synthase
VEAVFAQVEAPGAQPVLVFVSPNAVLGFFDAVATVRGVQAASLAWPAEAWAAATGPGTVAALRGCGVPDTCIVAPAATAAQFDSEALWSAIAGWSWARRPVWIVRGNGGRDWLGGQMRAAGADVRVVQSYGRAAPTLTPAEHALLADALARPACWVWLFSSSEAIDHLAAIAPDARWPAGRALASHPRIAERALALGFGSVTVVSPAPAAVAAALAPTPRP